MMDPWRDDPVEESDSRVGVDAYVDRTEEREPDNDQERHVSPSDNDGETVPADEVADQTGG
jgi:hypothetical protein